MYKNGSKFPGLLPDEDFALVNRAVDDFFVCRPKIFLFQMVDVFFAKFLLDKLYGIIRYAKEM